MLVVSRSSLLVVGYLLFVFVCCSLFVVRGCCRVVWFVRLLCVVCCFGGCVSFVAVCRVLIGVSCGSLLRIV